MEAIIDPSAVRALYRDWSDAELRAVLVTDSYTQAAKDAAAAELERRGHDVPNAQAVAEVEQLQEEAVDPLRPRPWARFIARKIDLTLWALPWMVFWSVVPVHNPFVRYVLYVVSWAFMEALLLSVEGTTPGKALFRLWVEDDDGHLLTFDAALARTARLFVYGLGLGLPLVYIIEAGFAFDRLRAKGSTVWDDASGTRVRADRAEALSVEA